MELFEVISSDYHGFFISQERPCHANLSSPSKNGGLSDETGLHTFFFCRVSFPFPWIKCGSMIIQEITCPRPAAIPENPSFGLPSFLTKAASTMAMQKKIPNKI